MTAPSDITRSALRAPDPAMVERAPLALFELDADGRLLAAHAALEQLTGLAADSLPGHGWLSAVPADARPLLLESLAGCRDFSLELQLGGARNPRAWVELSAWHDAAAGRFLCLCRDAGPARQRERHARAEAQRLRRLTDSLPLAIAYFEGPDLRCRYANRQWAWLCAGVQAPSELWGRAADDAIVGAPPGALADFLRGAWRERRVLSLTATLRATGPQAPTWLDLQALPHLGQQGAEVLGVFVLGADMTARQAADAAAARAEARLAGWMGISAEAILRIEEGRVADANPAAAALLGSAPCQLAGCEGEALVVPEHREALRAALDNGSEGSLDSAILQPDGTRVPVELRWRAGPQPAERWWVLHDPRERLALQARIHHLAHHDSLTGLPNRGTFLGQAEQAFARARAEGQRVALLFVDIDHFKRVNDSLGHEAGDAMLQAVAERITQSLRVTDLVGRFAGDEFVVLLAGDPEHEAIEEVARKLLQAIEAPLPLDGPAITVTPSIGIAVYPDHSTDPAELLKQADTAMDHAKALGRARYLFFEPDMARAAYDALVLESDLAEALRVGQFSLAFQPQVRHGDGALVGVEALVRWRHPQRGWVNPDDFIPLAEKRRLMLGIGRWVLDEALRSARAWRDAGLCEVPVGVNLTAVQFQGGGFVDGVREALEQHGADGSCLELELTERMLMDDLPDGQATLGRLRELGVRVALDDFGTGTTSLSQLKTLRVDRLKIDRSFVQDLPDDRASAAVADAIIRLAVGLDLDVVAEGVENFRQWDWLAAHGCAQVQGHLVAAPMQAAAFEAWLRGRPPRGAAG